MGMQGLRKAKGLNHMRQGFDNDKYIALQAEHIRSRINQFGGKLYLEFGGKLFDDYHASRVLPGFEPDSKFRMLKTMVDEVEIIIAINANHIEKSKTRGDLGITYDEEVLRLLDVFRSRGFATSGVVITHFENQPSAAAYAKTITTGAVHTWAEFDYNGGAYGESGFYGKNMEDEFDCRVIGSESEVLRALYNAINDGHPVVLYVTTGSGSQHWVTVIGYEGVDNPDNLSTDNFIILDPDRTSGLEPESLFSRGLTLRYGDWMGNVRISYASADVDDGRVPSEHFSDCFYGDWFVDSGVVDYVFDHGYITGYAGTTLFGPANGLRRSEAVTILWRVAGKPQVASEKPQFDDANYEDFYGQALTWAREVGVVNGWDGTNDFAPDMEVSREQLAKMIANYANKIAGANTAADQSNLDIFDDADAISPWARDAVAWCAQAGVLTGSPANGSNNALPQFVADRAATAKMVTVLARDVLALG